jgi:hypothetical protein
MTLSMPQIHMLSHAAHVNYERSQMKFKLEREYQKARDERDPIVWNGKRFSEMTTDEIFAYMQDGVKQ